MIALTLSVLDHYGLFQDGNGQVLTDATIMILCPFHEEHTPSCSVSLEREYFFCFGCEEQGDLIRLIAKLEGITDLQALRRLVQIRRGIPKDARVMFSAAISSHSNPQVSRTYFRALVKPDWEAMPRSYMRMRGFSPETLRRFDVRINDWAEYETIWPIRENGIFKGYQMRASDDRPVKYLFSRGLHKKEVVYGDLRLGSGRPLVMVEGALDRWAVWQNAYKYVASTLNWATSEVQAKKLAAGKPSMYIAAHDNDEPGEEGFALLKRQMRKLTPDIPVVRLTLPRWCHDPADTPPLEMLGALERAIEGVA